jgi:hypothetical protein
MFAALVALESIPYRLFRCRVLVVNDDPLVLQTAAAILAGQGEDVHRLTVNSR